MINALYWGAFGLWAVSVHFIDRKIWPLLSLELPRPQGFMLTLPWWGVKYSWIWRQWLVIFRQKMKNLCPGFSFFIWMVIIIKACTFSNQIKSESKGNCVALSSLGKWLFLKNWIHAKSLKITFSCAGHRGENLKTFSFLFFFFFAVTLLCSKGISRSWTKPPADNIDKNSKKISNNYV